MPGGLSSQAPDPVGSASKPRQNCQICNFGGRAGLFNTGDPVTLSATFIMSPKQTITSP